MDLAKAYDQVLREEVWECLRLSGVAEGYVRIIQDMYQDSQMEVWTPVRVTEEFGIGVGLHYGLTH